MYILNALHSESNSKILIKFGGGDLSFDSVLLLIKEFTDKLDFQKLLKSSLNYWLCHNLSWGWWKSLPDDLSNTSRLFNDNDSDELTHGPILNTIRDKWKY